VKTANEMIEALFAAGIVKGLSKKAAALAAGCPESTANHSATRLYKKPAVQAAIESARKELQTKTCYGVQECVREIDDAIVFARANKNSMAVAALLKLKAQLMGLLIDKLDVRWAEKPSIEMALFEARNRTKIVNPPQLNGPEPTNDIFGD
jgi:hypothetical protein